MKAPKTLLIGTNAGIVVSSPRRPSLAAMMKSAKVLPGTYAAELVERVYEYFIETAIDLNREFNLYYSAEYSSFDDFLYRRFAMSTKSLTRLTKYAPSGGYLLLVRWRRPSNDPGVRELLRPEVGRADMVARVLQASWKDYDNED